MSTNLVLHSIAICRPWRLLSLTLIVLQREDFLTETIGFDWLKYNFHHTSTSHTITILCASRLSLTHLVPNSEFLHSTCCYGHWALFPRYTIQRDYVLCETIVSCGLLILTRMIRHVMSPTIVNQRFEQLLSDTGSKKLDLKCCRRLISLKLLRFYSRCTIVES